MVCASDIFMIFFMELFHFSPGFSFCTYGRSFSQTRQFSFSWTLFRAYLSCTVYHSAPRLPSLSRAFENITNQAPKILAIFFSNF